MVTKQSEATWEGDLKSGEGTMTVGDDYYTGSFTFASRFEDAEQTNPEELLGAAHAGCFSMQLSANLDGEGFTPERVHTTASVHLDPNEGITRIDLDCEAEVPDIDEETFQEIAREAKENCHVSNLFAGTEIGLTARLV